MRAAGGVNANLFTIESGRFYFSFVVKVPILVKHKDDPADHQTENDQCR